MNRRTVFACVSFLLASWGYAQDVVDVVDDSVRDDSVKIVEGVRSEGFDMPEGMLIGEEELMKDYSNATNLTEGVG